MEIETKKHYEAKRLADLLDLIRGLIQHARREEAIGLAGMEQLTAASVSMGNMKDDCERYFNARYFNATERRPTSE